MGSISKGSSCTLLIPLVVLNLLLVDLSFASTHGIKIKDLAAPHSDVSNKNVDISFEEEKDTKISKNDAPVHAKSPPRNVYVVPISISTGELSETGRKKQGFHHIKLKSRSKFPNDKNQINIDNQEVIDGQRSEWMICFLAICNLSILSSIVSHLAELLNLYEHLKKAIICYLAKISGLATVKQADDKKIDYERIVEQVAQEILLEAQRMYTKLAGLYGSTFEYNIQSSYNGEQDFTQDWSQNTYYRMDTNAVNEENGDSYETFEPEFQHETFAQPCPE